MAKVNKVEVEIVATDEASPKIDRLEKKIDGLESDEARVIVTADISRLEKQLAGSKRLMEELEGDELTVQMRATGRIEDDLRAARELFDQLDGKTGTVTLTADTSGFDAAATRARTGIDDIGRSAGSSKSVLANMVGNTTQDLGALGGVAGSAGVAIGQMGEYMADAVAEGERLGSVTSNFAKVAGPIVVLAGGVALATAAWSAYKKNQQEAREEAEKMLKVQEELAGQKFTEAAQTLADTYADLFADLERRGVTATRAIQFITGAARDLGIEEEANRQIIEDHNTELSALLQQAIQARNAFSDQNVELTEQRDLTSQIEDTLATIYGTVTSQVPAWKQIADEIGRAADRQARFGADGVEQMGEVEQAADDVADSVSSIRSEWELLLGVLDKREAVRNAERALEDVRTAAEEAFIAGATGAEDAEEKMRDYEDAVDDAVRKLIAAGEDPVTINTVLQAFDQGMINEALAIGQAKLDAAPALRLPVSLDFRDTNLRIDRDLNVQSRYTPPRPSLQFAPATPNVTIINPPGTPAATAGELQIFQSRNGVR